MQKTKIFHYFRKRTIQVTQETTSKQASKQWRIEHEASTKLSQNIPALKYAKKCAQKRWSGLIRRIGVSSNMKASLGQDLWNDFRGYAKKAFYKRFIRRFQKRKLRCSGTTVGSRCPRKYIVRLDSDNECIDRLGQLHLDHEIDLQLICETWRNALPRAPITWHDGIHKDVLCDFLFGRKFLKFQCCQKETPVHERCHRTDLPHYHTAYQAQNILLDQHDVIDLSQE